MYLKASNPTNASVVATLCSTSTSSVPVLYVANRTPHTHLRGRSFRTISVRTVTGPIDGVTIAIHRTTLIPHILRRTFRLVHSNHPNPMLISLPFSMRITRVRFSPSVCRPLPICGPTTDHVRVRGTMRVLVRTRHPIVITKNKMVGTSTTTLLRRFTRLADVPIVPALVN